MKITILKLFLLIALASLCQLSVAARSESINLTSAEIHSSEGCPDSNRESIKLNCNSYHQTTNYTCGPAAIMTLLNYYGRLSAKEMNQRKELEIAQEMGAKPGEDGGTSQAQVESWLTAHHFRVESGQRVTTDMIVENLKKGEPTLIGFSHHWILAKGFNKGASADKDEIVFADSCCNVKVITRDTIDYMWLNSQRPANHCSDNIGIYILAVPE